MQDNKIFNLVISLMTILLFILILIFFIKELNDWYIVIFNNKEPVIRKNETHHFIIESSLAIATLAIALVAWIQMVKVREINHADFLQRIIHRYTSSEIIKARIVINQLYLKSKPDQLEATRRAKIRKEIEKIRISKIKNDQENFVHLLNLLDFIETICFFANKGQISSNDMNALIGNSLEFYYEIFEDWIKSRREKYSRNNYYCEFTKLIARNKFPDQCFICRIIRNIFCCNFK